MLQNREGKEVSPQMHVCCGDSDSFFKATWVAADVLGWSQDAGLDMSLLQALN